MDPWQGVAEAIAVGACWALALSGKVRTAEPAGLGFGIGLVELGMLGFCCHSRTIALNPFASS